MTTIQLLEYLKRQAVLLRDDRDFLPRNSHMHGLKEAPSQEVVDAVLTAFINQVGMSQGVDYGIYACDLATPQNSADAPTPSRPALRAGG